MPEERRELRAVERKYRKLERRTKWEKQKSVLPFVLVLVLLTAGLIALLLWFSRKPADPMPASKLDVFVLDVGQGDAILLRSEGHFALLDSGDTDGGSRLVQRLHAMGVRQLDFAVISHPHSDHMGGMAQVLAEFGAQRLYQPEIPAELLPTVYSYEHLLKTAQEHNIPVTVPHCGDTLTLGAAAVQFLSVENSAFEDLNDCSLGCLVTCGSHRFLFCGDLEKAGESAMLSAGLIPRVSVLKLSHHGSASSTSEAFLAAASPQIAVISVGAMNDYGHPAEQTLARLKAAGTAVYRTDLSGTLRLATDGEQLIVQTNAE